MPLWKVYHPVGAFTAEDKKALAKRVTEVYVRIPIPKFLWCSFLRRSPRTPALLVASRITNLSGSRSTKLPGRYPVRSSENGGLGHLMRQYPYVDNMMYDWEISIDETPFDLWSLQGELAPPFESVAEKRWVKENKASSYTLAEKLPVNLILAPGIADR
jgi:hypothetical protein